LVVFLFTHTHTHTHTHTEREREMTDRDRDRDRDIPSDPAFKNKHACVRIRSWSMACAMEQRRVMERVV
jgi:hypothetical protein